MPAPTPPKPQTNSQDKSKQEEPLEIEGPEEESFDEKYNRRQEFPLALVATILFHVAVGAFIVMLFAILPGEDKGGVPVKLVYFDGLDDAGEGSAGSGGVDDPAFRADGDPTKGKESFLDPEKLPEIKEKMEQTIKAIDPTGNLPISSTNAQAYESLSESVKNKLLGQRQGAGPGQGSGYDGTQGKGPGGNGADSTLGRNLRWVLRFKVQSGRDYLDQLRTMGAELLLPEPATDKCILIADLNKPGDQRLASDNDMRRLGSKVKFSDSRPEIVRAVAKELGISGFTPKSFWAFFPKELENDLSKKEKGYRNRNPEDIEETIFLVTVNGTNFDFRVVDQKVKR